MKKNVLIGVCGGIASYKVCELIRLLRKNNFSVKVMMTQAAAKFVTPLVFKTLSNNPVYIDMFEYSQEDIEHTSLASWADLCVVAPLSANTLSKIACGICDNLLTTVICALPASTKVMLVPAMNDNMWKNAIIKENVRKLKKNKNYLVMEPEKGELACGDWGEGRLPEVKDIFRELCKILKIQSPLIKGLKK